MCAVFFLVLVACWYAFALIRAQWRVLGIVVVFIRYVSCTACRCAWACAFLFRVPRMYPLVVVFVSVWSGLHFCCCVYACKFCKPWGVLSVAMVTLELPLSLDAAFCLSLDQFFCALDNL